MKKWIILGLLAVSVGVSVEAYLVFTGPRMKHDIKLGPFQAVPPTLPQGVVPVNVPPWTLPDAAQAEKLGNPLAATAENIARGRTYYGYYCGFCHGADGAGDGPVGRSYVPAPRPLRGDGLKVYSDGQLLRRMLTGEGHFPVLERVVHSEHRWYLVLYLRYLSHAGAAIP